MKTENDLRTELRAIDHRGYPAYKSLAGAWRMRGFTFVIDHVQGDPFAAPSSVHVEIDGSTAGFPSAYRQTRERKRALEDHLARLFAEEAAQHTRHAGSGKSGAIECSRPGQEILERTASHVDSESGAITLRFRLGFPARGRTIDAAEMGKLVFEDIPKIVTKSLLYKNIDQKALQEVIDLADDQQALRAFIRENHLSAFVADGAILPRQSGVSQKPMHGAVPFFSPQSLCVTANLPHRGAVSGMGIREGITLIIGGGYHGKSTLLSALMLGVYDHIPGDGRELVVTDDSAVKVRAEDGRSVMKSDISMFIHNLPDGTDSRRFTSANASGSTSQAACITEAMEAGAKVLLIDEDTSATNLMMRDALMEQAVPSSEEPITPLIDRICDIHQKMGISTILVAGSFGAYFEKAGTVLRMDHYKVMDITAQAKDIAVKSGSRRPDISWQGAPSFRRYPSRSRVFSDPRLKMKTLGLEGFLVDHEMIDLRLVEQLADSEQTTALSLCLNWLEQNAFDKKRTLQEAVDLLDAKLQTQGLAFLSGNGRTVSAMAMPRKQEIFAAVNRYRGLLLS